MSMLPFLNSFGLPLRVTATFRLPLKKHFLATHWITQHRTRTMITDVSPFLSKASESRFPSAIRKLYYKMKPGVISMLALMHIDSGLTDIVSLEYKQMALPIESLSSYKLHRMEAFRMGGGNPDSQCFPVKKLKLELQSGEEMEVENIAEAMQYTASRGFSQLLDLLKELQMHYHQPITEVAPEIMVSNGAQSIITMAFEMMLNRGDTVFVEAPTYSGSLSFLEPCGFKIELLPCDSKGIIPNELESKLKAYVAQCQKPPVLYTVPTGSNPSGTCVPLHRKQQLYEIMQRYNGILLEDDPYYHLHFMEDYVPSYLSMDTDGRVLRFDSFSKIIGAGLRLGFVTGHPHFIHRLDLHAQASYLHPSGISQAVLLTILKHWKKAGFMKHMEEVQKVYRSRRDMCIKHIEANLKDKVRYVTPEAGMFVWAEVLGVNDTKQLVDIAAEDLKVLVVAGSSFYPYNPQSKHIRISFSTGNESQMEQGIQRLAKAIDAYKNTISSSS